MARLIKVTERAKVQRERSAAIRRGADEARQRRKAYARNAEFRKMLQNGFHVEVEYGEHELDHRDIDLDEEIKKVARAELMGSGYGLQTGVRDLSFGYPTRAKAVAAAKRIKKAFGRKVKARATGTIWP